MDEYVSKEDAINALLNKGQHSRRYRLGETWELNLMEIQEAINAIPATDVQEKRYCRMIPLEPDLRNCTNVFICTSCHQHIHLGFIRQKYSGSFCIECGAEVKDGDAE